MTRDKIAAQPAALPVGQKDDWLGPTSDIGSRLRALYGSVQEEGVPDQLLDLLEKLDQAEMAHVSSHEARDEK